MVEDSHRFRVACFGDIVGKAGRAVVRKRVRAIRDEHSLDMVIANGENSSGGVGLDPDCAREIFGSGVDVITLGDHSFNRREVLQMLDEDPRIVRPLNYPVDTPGRGWTIRTTPAGVKVGVFNVLGRIFVGDGLVGCPFRESVKVIEDNLTGCDVIIGDVHAEATSEKSALGFYLDGKVSLLYGTHTHVQTADEKVLPQGTAFLTDLGMCGPNDSVIGMEIETAVARFLSPLSSSRKVARGDARLNGLIMEYDLRARAVVSLQRISEIVKI